MIFFFLFLISSNIAMKCLLCLCMVFHKLGMHIGSLRGLKSGDINKCKDNLVKDKCKLIAVLVTHFCGLTVQMDKVSIPCCCHMCGLAYHSSLPCVVLHIKGFRILSLFVAFLQHIAFIKGCSSLPHCFTTLCSTMQPNTSS